MAKKPREKKENWLLIKADDEYARSDDDPDITEERPELVKTGRVVEEVEGEAPGWSSKTGKIDKPARRQAAEGRQEGRLSRLYRADAGDAEKQPPAGRELAARNQVRRLPAPGPHPIRTRSSF